jgi:hypothetical protein
LKEDFNGSIDGVRVYNWLLPPAEIRSLVNGAQAQRGFDIKPRPGRIFIPERRQMARHAGVLGRIQARIAGR